MEFKLFESIDEMKSLLDNKKPRLVTAGGKHICVIRTNETIQAFANECPHMGESLHNGNVNHMDEIICPLHSYRFNIFSGESIEKQCKLLCKIEVTYENGIFLVF